MSRNARAWFCAFSLWAFGACSTAYLGALAPPSSVTETPHTGQWTPIEQAVLMYTVDSALNDMFTYTPQDGNDLLASLGIYKVDMTSACGTSFDSNGRINILGTYVQNANHTGGAFNLSMNFETCPMTAADGSVYTMNGANFVVNGNVTSTTATDGTLNNSYTCPTVTGTLVITDPNNIPVSCTVSVTNALNYAWNSNLVVTGSFAGTMCTTAISGTVEKLLPVVAP